MTEMQAKGVQEISLPSLFSEEPPGSARFTPLLQSGDPAVIARELLKTFLWEQELTLLDPGLSPALLGDLGIEPRSVGKTLALEGKALPGTPSALVEALDSPGGGTLRLLSSGTTGTPKWCRHSFASLTRGIRRQKALEKAAWGLCYHPTHMGGIQVMLQALLNAGSLIDLYALSEEERLALLQSGTLTHLSATPTFYRNLVATPGVFPTIRQVTFGGDGFDPEVFRAVKATFPQARFRNIYALTETGPLLVSDSEVFEIKESRREHFRIEGEELQVWSGSPGNEAWLPTGDRVEVLNEAPLRIRFTGRNQDFAQVGGLKVSLREVEAELRAHPGIEAGRVFARSHPASGHLLVAEVVASKPIPSEKEIREFLRKRLQPHQIPRMIQFVKAVATTRSGKLKR